MIDYVFVMLHVKKTPIVLITVVIITEFIWAGKKRKKVMKIYERLNALSYIKTRKIACSKVLGIYELKLIKLNFFLSLTL